jgi:cytochrome P450
VLWHAPTAHTPDGDGFWSVATHAESQLVLHDPLTYSSVTGGDRPYGGTILPDTPVAGEMLNMMDDPRHARIRRLVSKGFTPRMIGRLEGELRRRAGLLLDDAVARSDAGEPVDFLTAVAAEVPLQAICILLGVPEADRHLVGGWIHHVFDFPDEFEFGGTNQAAEASMEMAGYGVELLARKRAEPADDLLSVVAGASLPDEDPSELSDGELLGFFFLLFAAGSDTTRSAAAGGVHALTRFPDEYERLRADRSLVPTAVDEMVRYVSPSAYNRRTVTTPTDLAGHHLMPGEKVVFWEASANRDELVFADPDRFDAGRQPNPHLGFGHGVHHCLGASLARLELTVILTDLLDRVATVESAGPPEWTRTNKHNGVRHLPVHVRR